MGRFWPVLYAYRTIRILGGRHDGLGGGRRGSMVPNILLFNKSVIVRIGGRNERINTKTVSISIKGDASTQNVVPHLHNGYIQTEPDGSNLFGLSGIQALKDIKVKFRERQDQDFL